MKCEDTDGKGNGSSCRPAYAGMGQAQRKGYFYTYLRLLPSPVRILMISWTVVVRAFVVTGLLEDMLLDGCLTREA